MSSLQAFPRADGSVGIRNIVLVVSTVTCANTVVNHIAWKTGAVPLTHERGCVDLHMDSDILSFYRQIHSECFPH